MKKGIIYGLVCPIINDIRYVGLTIQKPKERLKKHKYEHVAKLKKKHKLSYKDNWIRSIKKRGLLSKMIIITLEECEINYLAEREKFWIKYYRDKGNKITNSTDGGGVVHSTKLKEET